MEKIVIKLKSGEEVVMRRTPAGEVCPVCGAIGNGLPYDWYQSVLPDGSLSEPFGAASFDTCSCGTEYGNDDYVEPGGSIHAKWHELRLAWLDRIGSTDEAIRQLQENLETDPSTLRE